MDVTTVEWAITILVTIAVLTFDIIVIARDPHEPSFRECAVALSVYIGAAIAFGAWIWLDHGHAVRHRVLRRLADGVLPLDRQPVRLHHLDGVAAGAAGVPAGSADGGHRPGADLPGHLHRAGLPADRELQLGLLRVRRLPRLHRGHAGEELSQPRGRASRGQQDREVRPVPPQRRRRVPRAQALVPPERRPCRLPDADRDHRAGHHRPAVRARLDPGDLRHHPGAVPGLHGQRVRADGPAPALLPAWRPARAAGLPLARPCVHPGLHRRQAGPARVARELAAVHQRRSAGPQRPRHLLARQPRGDHRDPGGHRGGQPGEGPQGPASRRRRSE